MMHTFKVMKVIAAIAAFTAFSGCKAYLRAPFCAQGEYVFPEGAEGAYRLTLTKVDQEYSNYYGAIEEMVFRIANTDDSTDITMPQSLYKRLTKRQKATKSDEQPIGVMLLSTCKIGNDYFAQTHEDDGTYSVARFDLAPSGISLVDLTFSADELRRANIPTYYWPDVEVGDGQWQLTSIDSSGRIVVDNAGMDDQARMRLLQLAHPTALGTVLSRLDDHEAKRIFARTRQKMVTIRLPKKAH